MHVHMRKCRLPARLALALSFIGAAGCLELGGGGGEPGGGGGDAGDRPNLCSGGALGGDLFQIVEDTVLRPGDCDRVRGEIEVRARLTLEPGVTLRFEDGASLRFFEGGSLVAEGTEAAPVVLRGVREEPGAWKGLYFDSPTASRLINVRIENAGADRVWFAPRETAVFATGPTALSLRNVTVSGSRGVGLHLRGNVRLDLLEGVRVEASEGPALVVGPDQAIALTTANTFGGGDRPNTSNWIEVEEGHATRSGKWSALDIPWRLMGQLAIQNGVAIELGEGVSIGMAQGASIEVEGRLTSAGTAAAPVNLFGLTPMPGSWGGIDVRSPQPSELRHTNILHAGGINFFLAPAKSAVHVKNTGRLAMRDCRIEDSAAHGLVVADGGTLDALTRTTFVNNGAASVRVGLSAAGAIANDNVFTGNDTARRIELRGGLLQRSLTLQATAVPWYVIEETIIELGAGGQLTLPPGLQLFFGPAGGIDAWEGVLRVEGNAANPILMRGASAQPGYWRGIRVRTNGGDNLLQGLTLQDAGGDKFHLALERASLAIVNSGRCRVADVTVRDGGGLGVWVDEGATLLSARDNSPIINEASAAAAGLVSTGHSGGNFLFGRRP
jgi:hypothetical protein